MTAKIRLSNPRQPSLAPVEVAALADKDQVLLGAIPLEDVDLVVNPRDGSVDVDPDSPNIAQDVCKRAA